MAFEVAISPSVLQKEDFFSTIGFMNVVARFCANARIAEGAFEKLDRGNAQLYEGEAAACELKQVLWVLPALPASS